jgi:hypothetical protein
MMKDERIDLGMSDGDCFFSVTLSILGWRDTDSERRGSWAFFRWHCAVKERAKPIRVIQQ